MIAAACLVSPKMDLNGLAPMASDKQRAQSFGGLAALSNVLSRLVARLHMQEDNSEHPAADGQCVQCTCRYGAAT